MIPDDKKQSRRRFLRWGVICATVFSAMKFLSPAPVKKQTAKMLTQDGKLVEVDISAISSKKKKISNKELQNWIRK